MPLRGPVSDGEIEVAAQAIQSRVHSADWDDPVTWLDLARAALEAARRVS